MLVEMKIIMSTVIGMTGTYVGLVSRDALEGLGGWGFAVGAVYYIWNELKRERAECAKQRLEHKAEMKAERELANRRHTATIEFTRNCTDELKGIRSNLVSRPCIASREDIQDSLKSVPRAENIHGEQ